MNSSSDTKTDPRLIKLLKQAEAHGMDSGLDHEVSDLQDILIECWKYLPPWAQKKIVDNHLEDT